MIGSGRSALASAAASAALVWSWTRASAGTVSTCEERAFRCANERSDVVAAPVWLAMQAGSLGAVFAAGAAARLWPLANRSGPIVASGVTLWVGAKLVKRAVGRGRPRRHLRDVRIRGTEPSGLGYPSGHAAIATLLALVALPRGTARGLGLAVAGVTGWSRMYVGAHLPLDIVGGVAIGVLTAETSSAIAGSRKRLGQRG